MSFTINNTDYSYTDNPIYPRTSSVIIDMNKQPEINGKDNMRYIYASKAISIAVNTADAQNGIVLLKIICKYLNYRLGG